MVDFLRALSIVLLLGMFYLVFKNRKFKRFLLIESVLIIVFIICYFYRKNKKRR